MASSWLKMGERPSEKGVVVLGNPIYPFQTAYQIIVRTVHKKPSFLRRRESSL